ncbi:polyprenyl synthetase family protein [Rhodovulum sp. 12E13]|uniref:polyprenyl synthetase family protein n=1 Tax=Rhodovulum sp. 12E13 TaxID=2203891 RepID=UPI000E116518|nr:polyprenyl synthetase family protein [Rhodovulum sp. 12E13]RDC74739.1 polyprenyl synthetase family protein [Rhodovulum sp. 12E13]
MSEVVETDRFEARLGEAAARVADLLAAELAAGPDVPVVHAMRYALEGGKGLRGFLVIEGAALHGVAPEQAAPAAAAVEALHTYSLVHDDLPSMDDDEMRRGRPTVHVKWDEATAVLVGDALHCLAFELLAREGLGPAERRVALVRGLAEAAGMRGMVLGQALDIAAESAAAPLGLAEIERLQAAKTGALIRWSGEAGAVIAGADPAPLRHYAGALGLAFQIADDILDIEGDAALAGKRLHKDADAGKATFVSLLGLDGAKARAAGLVEEACDALSPYGDRADVLRQAARFVIARRK